MPDVKAQPRSVDFEKLVARIIAELESSATVTWNDHIVGASSGLPRQIDVSIRRDEGDFLGIVDAKDYKRRATIERIDALVGVMEDVQADYGALVCSGGFAKSILPYARRKGISLLNAHDAESVNWSRELQLPILWTELTPVVRVPCVARFEAGDSLVMSEVGLVRVTADRGQSVLDPIGTFERLWNEGSIPRSVGVEHTLASDQFLQALVHDACGARQLRPVERFAIEYTVRADTWLGRFQPSECRGFIDHLNGEKFYASNLPGRSVPLERDPMWLPVEHPEELAVTTRGTIVLAEAPILVSAGAVTEPTLEYLGP